MMEKIDCAVQKLSLWHCCPYDQCHKLSGFASITRELSERDREQKRVETHTKQERKVCTACRLVVKSINHVDILPVFPKQVSSTAISSSTSANLIMMALNWPPCISAWVSSFEQLQAQSDEEHCDAARQECNIFVGKWLHHYYSMSFIQTDTFLFICALSLSSSVFFTCSACMKSIQTGASVFWSVV